jgi:hypothetical protein
MPGACRAALGRARAEAPGRRLTRAVGGGGQALGSDVVRAELDKLVADNKVGV